MTNNNNNLLFFFFSLKGSVELQQAEMTCTAGIADLCTRGAHGLSFLYIDLEVRLVLMCRNKEDDRKTVNKGTVKA